MKRTVVLVVCLAAALSLAAASAEGPEVRRSESPKVQEAGRPKVSLGERFERAYAAWDSGDYVPALEGFKAVLASAGGDAYFERIALATGELYRVIELTADGRQPRFSPDGRYLSYETGSPAVIRILEVANPTRRVAELQGSAAAFSPAGDRVAYLRLGPGLKAATGAWADLTRAWAELNQLQGVANPDRQKVSELQRQITRAVAKQSEIVVRDLQTGREQALPDGGLLKSQLAWSGDGREVYFAGTQDGDVKSNDLYATSESLTQPRPITSAPTFKTAPVVAKDGRYLIYTIASASPFPAAGAARGGRPGGPGAGPRQFVLVSLADGTMTTYSGSAAEFSADGTTLAFVSQSGGEYSVQVVKPGARAEAVVAKKSPDRIGSIALAPDGSRVAFDMPHMPSRDAEIFCVNADGTGEVRVTREVQPDRAPHFLTATTLVAIKGEPRHSRSYLYDLAAPAAGRPSVPVRLFHNNTIRTIAPEYEWVPSSDGRHLLIVAERDGDTISPKRGVYLLDLGTKISKQDLVQRLDRNLAAERALRQRGAATFQPIAVNVKAAVNKVSMAKLYEYQAALFAFDSKYIGLPGNQKAADYIFETFKSFGYAPERQPFMAAGRGGAPPVRTENILATLKGTMHPEVVYVLCSHFDSVQRGPGADDNSTVIAVLLEAARILANTPMPATIVFAAFTGEEAGDLGSHEYVRQAVANKVKLAGVLNNDMIGWTNDYHLDNTIRYSNGRIRDLQHAAAFLFSKMVTYDAKYYKATDAQAFYDDYGDIIGGLGSYPVLGNPYYHQPTDLLETVNQQLVYEATRMNVASIMALASLRLRSDT